MGGAIRRRRTRPMAPAPDLVSLETLAFRLDCSVAEVERLCRTGVLPAPLRLGDLMRWEFEAVLAHIRRANGRVATSAAPAPAKVRLAANGHTGPEGDPFLSGVERVQPAVRKDAATAPS